MIPAANIMGGLGEGGGGDPRADGNRGAGGGFGVRATPAGMYVIDDGRVHWEPALNLNAVILRGQVVALMLFFTVRTLARVFADRRSTTVRRLGSRVGLR